MQAITSGFSHQGCKGVRGSHSIRGIKLRILFGLCLCWFNNDATIFYNSAVFRRAFAMINWGISTWRFFSTLRFMVLIILLLLLIKGDSTTSRSGERHILVLLSLYIIIARNGFSLTANASLYHKLYVKIPCFKSDIDQKRLYKS